MPAKKLKVVVTRKLPAPVELRLKELFDARLNDDDHPFSQEELADGAKISGYVKCDDCQGKILVRALRRRHQMRLVLAQRQECVLMRYPMAVLCGLLCEFAKSFLRFLKISLAVADALIRALGR